MRNIGPVSQQWLAEIEIYTQDDLQRVGAVATYRHVKDGHPKSVNKNLLWALLGAERDEDWRALPQDVKSAALAELGGCSQNRQ